MPHKIIPVIMSGGSGTRLWPASRKAAPKQLLALLSDQTMIQETAARLSGVSGDIEFLAPLIICNAAHGALISQQLADIGIKDAQVIVEPMGRNTAPCAAVAAMAAQAIDPHALILLAPADHHIADRPALHRAIGNAARIADEGYMVTFGITADRPETGYGYIQKGAPLHDGFSVKAFKEKPDAQTAQSYLDSGEYFWNAGIFLFRPSALLEEMSAHCPEIASASRKAFELGEKKDGALHLDSDSFAACPSDSIDYAVMEPTQRAATVPANIGWSDIGSWHALWDFGKDSASAEKNAVKGDVHVIDTTNTLIHSDGPFVATIGLENMVVVVKDGAVLVAKMDRVQDVKAVVEHLKSNERAEKL